MIFINEIILTCYCSTLGKNMQGSPVVWKGVFMLYNVIGIKRNMSFAGNDGKKVEGLKLYVTCPDDKVDGLMTDSFFIPTSSHVFVTANCLKPDMSIDIYFNRYGKIDGVIEQ